MAHEKKWHISKQDGIPRVCQAEIRPCPHGSQLTSHYETPQEALDVADKVNEMITKGVDFDKELRVINVKGSGRVRGKSEKALLYDRAMRFAYDELEEVRQQYSRSIAGQLEVLGIKNLKINGEDIVAEIRHNKGSVQKRLNEEAFKASDDYVDYLIPNKKSESVKVKGKEYKQAGSDIVKELSMNTPTGGVVKLNFDKDKDGNLVPTGDTVKMLEDYTKFTLKLKEMKATKDANSKNLMNAIKDAGVNNIRVRNMTVEYKPAHYELKIDRDKLKRDFGKDYGKYGKLRETRAYVKAVQLS